jgi:hypothetical protein
MRAVNISVKSTGSLLEKLRASFLMNRKYYVQEALGLSIFMISACFFSATPLNNLAQWIFW